MNVDLNKEDLINLVVSTTPNSMKECNDYTKKGLMKYIGNQHNQNWGWVKSELMKMTEYNLLMLYKKHK